MNNPLKALQSTVSSWFYSTATPTDDPVRPEINEIILSHLQPSDLSTFHPDARWANRRLWPTGVDPGRVWKPSLERYAHKELTKAPPVERWQRGAAWVGTWAATVGLLLVCGDALNEVPVFHSIQRLPEPRYTLQSILHCLPAWQHCSAFTAERLALPEYKLMGAEGPGSLSWLDMGIYNLAFGTRSTNQSPIVFNCWYSYFECKSSVDTDWSKMRVEARLWNRVAMRTEDLLAQRLVCVAGGTLALGFIFMKYFAEDVQPLLQQPFLAPDVQRLLRQPFAPTYQEAEKELDVLVAGAAPSARVRMLLVQREKNAARARTSLSRAIRRSDYRRVCEIIDYFPGIVRWPSTQGALAKDEANNSSEQIRARIAQASASIIAQP